MSHTSTAMNALAITISLLAALFVIAWVTFLPVVGLLYMTGYLS